MPPRSRLTPLTPDERQAHVRNSVIYGHYEKTIDRDSAFEMLKAKAEEAARAREETPHRETWPARGQAQGTDLFTAMAKSAAHAIGSQVGRQIMRGLLGSIFGSRKR